MVAAQTAAEANPLAAAAILYAGWGWSVVPVHSVGARGSCTCRREACPSVAKHPRVRWEQAMAAPASVEELEAWWQRWPEANVGVVTGEVSGVAVVDVDPRNGGDVTLRELEARHGILPVTAEVRTGGGGQHLWFTADGPLPSGELGPGLELKGDGGMVVAPPSVHASGKSYVWRPGGSPQDVPPADAPAWFEDVIGGRVPVGAPHRPQEGPVRTLAEQAEFAEAWSHAGIDLGDGDRYYLCPFHDDHHPSLHVDAEGCRWYCFACRRGGGIGTLRRLLGERSAPSPRTRLRSRIEPESPVTLCGSYEVEVVGESHHQDELLELTGGRRRYGGVDVEAVADLVPEPANPYDPSAVAVVIDERAVGYIRRKDLEWLRSVIDDSLQLHGRVTCRARICGGWDRGHGEVGWFGVTLLMPDPSDALW